MYVGTEGNRTMFSIQTSSGKLIKSHSYFEQEDEILLAPGRFFEVVDKMSPAAGLYIIHIQEIEPPYKMLADPFDLTQLKKTLPSGPSKIVVSNEGKRVHFSTKILLFLENLFFRSL